MGSPDAVRGRIEALVGLADVVKASADDLAWLLPGRAPEQVAEAWPAKGPAMVVITLGPAGLLAATRQAGVLRRPGRAVEVIDTVGAGDACTAALLAGLAPPRPARPGPPGRLGRWTRPPSPSWPTRPSWPPPSPAPAPAPTPTAADLQEASARPGETGHVPGRPGAAPARLAGPPVSGALVGAASLGRYGKGPGLARSSALAAARPGKDGRRVHVAADVGAGGGRDRAHGRGADRPDAREPRPAGQRARRHPAPRRPRRRPRLARPRRRAGRRWSRNPEPRTQREPGRRPGVRGRPGRLAGHRRRRVARTGPARAGRWAGGFTATGPGDQGMALAEVLERSPGRTYAASLWIRAERWTRRGR